MHKEHNVSATETTQRVDPNEPDGWGEPPPVQGGATGASWDERIQRVVDEPGEWAHWNGFASPSATRSAKNAIERWAEKHGINPETAQERLFGVTSAKQDDDTYTVYVICYKTDV